MTCMGRQAEHNQQGRQKTAGCQHATPDAASIRKTAVRHHAPTCQPTLCLLWLQSYVGWWLQLRQMPEDGAMGGSSPRSLHTARQSLFEPATCRPSRGEVANPTEAMGCISRAGGGAGAAGMGRGPMHLLKQPPYTTLPTPKGRLCSGGGLDTLDLTQ
jgi:hypothetical protein